VSKFNKEECVAFIKENYKSEEENNSPFTGKFVDEEFSNHYLEAQCKSRMSEEDIETARARLFADACEFNLPFNENDWRAIMDIHEELMEWRKAPKRSQWECVQLNVSSVEYVEYEGNFVYAFDSSKAVSIRAFDSKKDASQAKAIVTVPVSITRAKKVADKLNKDLLIFKAVPFTDIKEEVLMITLERIYSNGIVDLATGKRYLIATQSASQARQGAFWFYEADNFDEVDDFRLKCLKLTAEQYKEAFGDIVLMSKLEARVGLSVSNTLDMNDVAVECRDKEFINIVNGLNVKIVPDVYVTVKTDAIVPLENVPGATQLIKDKELELCASDGCGLMSVSTCAKLNYGLHLISHKEYTEFCTLWDGVDKMLSNVEKGGKLYRIIMKLSKVLQFRHAGDKGIVVIADMEAYEETHDVDIMLHDSVRKYDFGDWADAPLEICMYDKPKKGIANLNFQFIQALNIKPEDLINIAKEPLEYVTENVLKDYAVAMKFLGMIERIGSEEEDASVVTKLTEVLQSDPIMLQDPQVQKWMIEKVNKFIDDICIGRIPVEGAYYFIVTDPRYLLSQFIGKDIRHLAKGQYYCNGWTDEMAIFRSPLIHSSEASRVQLVADDDLWYYTDLLIFNPYDDTAQRAGGADYDGDKMLGTRHRIIVEAIQCGQPLLYDTGRAGKKVGNNWNERIKYFLTTSKRDQTGYITNLATKWTDLKINWGLAGNQANVQSYDNAVKYLRFLQGWEIDKAKTGIGADGEDGQGFPTSLKIKQTPEWFIGMRKIQGRDVTVKEENIYHSNAPLGKLYAYVMEFKNELKLLKNAEAKCYHLSKTFTQDEINAVQAILPKVREIEKMYCKEVANITNYYKVSLINKGQFGEACGAIYDKYNHVMMSMVNDGVSEDVVAFSAYYVANDKPDNKSKSTTFPWTCMFDSMIRLLYKNNNKVSLVRLPELNEIDNVKVANGCLMINGDFYDYVSYPEKDYQIKVIDGKPFIVVPKEVDVDTTEAKASRFVACEAKTYPLTVNGFKYYGLNSENFIQHVTNNNGEFSVVVDTNGNVRIAIADMVIGNLASKEFEAELVGKKLVLSSCSNLTYLPKKITTSTQMKNDKEAYCGQLNITAVIYGNADIMPISVISTDMPSAYDSDADAVSAWEAYMASGVVIC
jgi:hypothetical protein